MVGLKMVYLSCAFRGSTLSVTPDQNAIARGGARKRELARGQVVQRVVKSCLDYVGAGILIIILSPVFALVGMLVAVESGWPIIYRRRVVGVKGEFDAYKFRTMKHDADEVLAAD